VKTVVSFASLTWKNSGRHTPIRIAGAFRVAIALNFHPLVACGDHGSQHHFSPISESTRQNLLSSDLGG
jgi:hypothetical protein